MTSNILRGFASIWPRAANLSALSFRVSARGAGDFTSRLAVDEREVDASLPAADPERDLASVNAHGRTFHHARRPSLGLAGKRLQR